MLVEAIGVEMGGWMRLSREWDLEKRTSSQRKVHNDTAVESKVQNKDLCDHMGRRQMQGSLKIKEAAISLSTRPGTEITETMAAFASVSTPIQAALTSKRLIL